MLSEGTRRLECKKWIQSGSFQLLQPEAQGACTLLKHGVRKSHFSPQCTPVSGGVGRKISFLFPESYIWDKIVQIQPDGSYQHSFIFYKTDPKKKVFNSRRLALRSPAGPVEGVGRMAVALNVACLPGPLGL